MHMHYCTFYDPEENLNGKSLRWKLSHMRKHGRLKVGLYSLQHNIKRKGLRLLKYLRASVMEEIYM